MSVLQGLFGPPDVEKLRDKGDVKGLIKALGYKKDKVVQQDAINALENIGAPAISPLILALGEGKFEVRGKAVEVLGKIGAPAVGPLIKSLRTLTASGYKNPSIYKAITTALGEIGAPAVEPLLAVFTNEEMHLNPGWGAMWFYTQVALVEIGRPAVEPIIAALKDSDGMVTINIISVLGEIGDVRAVEPLIHKLSNSNESYSIVIVDTIKTLGKLGDKRAVEPLIHILSEERLFDFHNSLITIDDNNALVFATIEALGNLGDRRAIKPIIAASERWLEQELRDLKSWEDFGSSDSAKIAAKMLQNTSFGGSSDYTKNLLEKYNHDKKLVQDAIARLRLLEEETEKSSTKAGETLKDKGEWRFSVKEEIFQKGVEAAQAGQYEEALKNFDEYLFRDGFELRPSDAEAWNNRAFVLGFLNRDEESIKSCDTAIMLRGNYADPYDLKARALMRLKRYEEALPTFKKYIELAPPEAMDRIRDANKAVERLQALLSFGKFA